jgi:hypothetical protein
MERKASRIGNVHQCGTPIYDRGRDGGLEEVIEKLERLGRGFETRYPQRFTITPPAGGRKQVYPQVLSAHLE